MAVYQVKNVIRDVRICIDENRTDESLLQHGDEETLRLDEVIRSKILEGIERVHKIASFTMLEQGHNIEDSESVALYWGDLESGWILLPEDFMRLVVFEMDDWDRPVYSVVTPDMPEYAKCRSRIKAIRGTAQNPRCALTVHPSGKMLEFYSCKSRNARVRKGVYIPYPKMEDVAIDGVETECVDISKRCYEAIIYTIAGLTLTTLGEYDAGKQMFGLADGLINM